MAEISVCIVSFNTRSYLEQSLKSILAVQLENMEIVVVDNGSTDSTREMLQNTFPEVRLICNDNNLGYTAAMNQAMRAASGHYLMQLNPDTIVKPTGFPKLQEYLHTHPEVGICTPRILNVDGSLQKQCRRSAARPWDVITYFLGLSSLFPKSRLFGRYLLTWAPTDEILEVDAVSGSCMILRRELLESIGYLDETFFAYQEDSDYCFRARQKGWKILYLPLADVVHYGGLGGSRHEPFRAIYEWHRSYYKYYRKHLSRKYFFLVNWIMYIGMALKLVFSLGINLIRSEKIVGTRKPHEL